MASFSTTQTHSSPVSSSSQLGDDDVDTSKADKAAVSLSLTLTWPFSIPSSPEATSGRLVKNLVRFKLVYALFIWSVLAIALIPQRKVSLLLLILTANFTLLYALMLKAMPDSFVLHRLIDKRLVAALVVIVITVEMILTRAGVHLGVVVSSCVPVILLHAVLVAPEWEFGGFYCRIGQGSRHDDDNLASHCV